MGIKIAVFLKTIWQSNSHFRGLQLVTAGFILSLFGAIVTVLSIAAHSLNELSYGFFIISKIFLYGGWSLILIGALVFSIGGILHWIEMFSNSKR